MPLITMDFGSSGWTGERSTGLRLPLARGQLTLIDRSYFEPPTSVQAHLSQHTTVQIGAFCSISGGRLGNVSIGRYCSIAPDVMIGANEHPTDWLTTSRIAYQPELHSWAEFLAPERVPEIAANRRDPGDIGKMTVLGNDVWIGQDVFIKAGVRIGDGAVIAARSVVTRDVPPYSIVGGVPAKVLKMRFDPHTISRLTALQWWRFSIFDIYDINFQTIGSALDEIQRRIDSHQIQEYRPKKITLEVIAGLLKR
ncbi:CatB-related O-acetyltransferase [Microvirga aerilata]|nr:CatB-related O-acetyltransferase [Microvirga aerilata]